MNTKRTLQVATTILVTTLILSGCKKNSEPLVSGAFNGTITATVENGDDYNAYFSKVWACIGADENSSGGLDIDEVVAQGTYANGGFSISLPSTVSNELLTNVQVFFEDEMRVSGNIKYSDPDAELAGLSFLALNASNEWFGFFYSADSDAAKRTFCFIVYANADVDVTGGPNVSFKKGWNRLYYSAPKSLVTTKEPNGITWYFEDDL